MTIKTITPFLRFDGHAQEAIGLYERVLGARTESLLRFGEIPAAGGTCAADDRDRVAHASLRFGAVSVMVGDAPSSMPVPKEPNVAVCLDFEDARDMAKRFEALAESGQVVMGIADTFWGAKFGVLVDAFGIQWMFNCMTQPQ